eukprot:1979376-Prymnesium_polylepis.1
MPALPQACKATAGRSGQGGACARSGQGGACARSGQGGACARSVRGQVACSGGTSCSCCDVRHSVTIPIALPCVTCRSQTNLRSSGGQAASHGGHLGHVGTTWVRWTPCGIAWGPYGSGGRPHMCHVGSRGVTWAPHLVLDERHERADDDRDAAAEHGRQLRRRE